MNDIQILRPKQAEGGFFPDGKAGDMLVSMRNINTIALIGKVDRKIKWAATKFSAQHSPRITDYGSLLVFDNLASNEQYGRSRITELEISSKKIIGIWEGSKSFHFESGEGGRLQILGERILVQESDKGRLFELTCIKRPISQQCEKKENNSS